MRQVYLFRLAAIAFLLSLLILFFVLPTGSGDGHWVYNVAGATLMFSFLTSLSLCVIFGVWVGAASISLGLNEWVWDVEDMDWVNPSHNIWLFAKRRGTWAAIMIIASFPLACVGGFGLLGLSVGGDISPDVVVPGVEYGLVISVAFAWVLHRAYALGQRTTR